MKTNRVNSVRDYTVPFVYLETFTLIHKDGQVLKMEDKKARDLEPTTSRWMTSLSIRGENKEKEIQTKENHPTFPFFFFTLPLFLILLFTPLKFGRNPEAEI